MRLETPVQESEITTSRSVANLAHDARRVLAGLADESDAVDVLLRIEILREEYRGAPSAPIHAWLNNLRRQLQRS